MAAFHSHVGPNVNIAYHVITDSECGRFDRFSPYSFENHLFKIKPCIMVWVFLFDIAGEISELTSAVRKQ